MKGEFCRYNVLTRESEPVGDRIRLTLADGNIVELSPCEGGVEVRVVFQTAGRVVVVPDCSNMVRVVVAAG